MMLTCYCCSGKSFEECCKPIVDGIRKANTAEELMRLRYSAYASATVEFKVTYQTPDNKMILHHEHSHSRQIQCKSVGLLILPSKTIFSTTSGKQDLDK